MWLPFWMRHRHDGETIAADIRQAQEARNYTEELIAKIDAQEPEVLARTNRLEERKIRNHFAESMIAAMGGLRGET